MSALVTTDVAQDDGTWLVALHGDHDIATLAELRRETNHIWALCSVAIIDLSGVGFIDSGVIRWLLEARGNSRRQGRSPSASSRACPAPPRHGSSSCSACATCLPRTGRSTPPAPRRPPGTARSPGRRRTFGPTACGGSPEHADARSRRRPRAGGASVGARCGGTDTETDIASEIFVLEPA